MTGVINQICDAIRRHPHISRVVVSPAELETIRIEFEGLSFVKPSPRPTYGAPYGDIDRFLWDEAQAMMKRAPVQIMGRPVEARVA